MSDVNVLPVAILIFGALVIATELTVFFFAYQQKPQVLGLQEVRVFSITVIAVLLSTLAVSNIALERFILLIIVAVVGGWLFSRQPGNK
jgi:hypothetical protein